MARVNSGIGVEGGDSDSSLITVRKSHGCPQILPWVCQVHLWCNKLDQGS